MHASDRQTDGQTEFPSLYRDCIPCSAVKNSMMMMMMMMMIRHSRNPLLYANFTTVFSTSEVIAD